MAYNHGERYLWGTKFEDVGKIKMGENIWGFHSKNPQISYPTNMSSKVYKFDFKLGKINCLITEYNKAFELDSVQF